MKKIAALLLLAASAACAGPHKSTGALSDKGADFANAKVDSAGTVTASARPAELMKTLRTQTTDNEQILFGDLHVHSTVSWDAFVFSPPEHTPAPSPAVSAFDAVYKLCHQPTPQHSAEHEPQISAPETHDCPPARSTA